MEEDHLRGPGFTEVVTPMHINIEKRDISVTVLLQQHEITLLNLISCFIYRGGGGCKGRYTVLLID